MYAILHILYDSEKQHYQNLAVASAPDAHATSLWKYDGKYMTAVIGRQKVRL